MTIRISRLAAALAGAFGATVTAASLLTTTACAAQLMSPATTQPPAVAANLAAILTAQNAAQGLDANHGVTFARQHPGAMDRVHGAPQGTQVTRFDYTYKGVRIFGADAVVVTDASGKPVSVTASDRGQNLGKGAANRLGPSTADFDVTPVLSTKAAIDAALRTLPPGATHQVPATAELIIYPIVKTERMSTALTKSDADLNAVDVRDVVESYELAYLVHTRMHLGKKPLFYDTVVSARDGHLLMQWSMLQTVVGVGNSQYNGSVAINTTLVKGSYQMIDASRGIGGSYGAMAITNANHGTSAGSVYTNSSNTWGDGKQYIAGGSTTNANGQTAAVNALWGLMNTYDMLKGALGWQSLDGHNTATYIAAHVNTAYDNAYYSDTCKCMFIGDGSSFNSLGAIDVIGHEMGHGVTAATSNLTYSGESGGLNESSSDINGEMVEAYARAGGTGATIPATGNDWGVGKEISKNGVPLRYMFKPSKDGASPDAWSTSLKRLDVHYSSGPNNRMFYFLAQGSNATKTSDFYSRYLVKKPLAMTGIGNDKAYRIWFKAATTKFTASTNYADARAKVLLAAQELYGANSKEAKAVQRAYAAINVGADIDE